MTEQTWKIFETINRNRRAIKHFTDETISDEDMKAALAAAQFAPSSFNMQPYELHWVKNKSVIEQIRVAHPHQRAIQSAQGFVVVVAKWKNLNQHYNLYLNYVENSGLYNEKAKEHFRKKEKEIKLFTNPLLHSIFAALKPIFVLFSKHLILVPFSRSGIYHWASRNSIYAAQTFMLAVQARGIDTCPMEGFNPFKISKILNIKDGIIPIVIAVGKRNPEKELTPHWRLPFEETVIIH